MTSLSFNDWFLDTNSRAPATIATTIYTSITSMDALEAIYRSLPDMNNNNIKKKNPNPVSLQLASERGFFSGNDQTIWKETVNLPIIQIK